MWFHCLYASLASSSSLSPSFFFFLILTSFVEMAVSSFFSLSSALSFNSTELVWTVPLQEIVSRFARCSKLCNTHRLTHPTSITCKCRSLRSKECWNRNAQHCINAHRTNLYSSVIALLLLSLAFLCAVHFAKDSRGQFSGYQLHSQIKVFCEMKDINPA